MKISVLMTVAIAAVTSLTAIAQPQPYSGRSPRDVHQVMPSEALAMQRGSMNDKQREEIQKIRTEQLKERTQSRNLLNEKRAKLETLQTADKPNMKAINKVIDEIAAIQAQQMKSQAASRQKIRNLLTEEQRVQFDAQYANRENMRPEGAFRPTPRQAPPEKGRHSGRRGR